MLLTDNKQNKIEVSEGLTSLLEDIIDYALKYEGVKYEYEISLLYVDNEIIKDINIKHRNINKATDVLSFPMLEYKVGTTYVDHYLDFTFDQSYFDEGKLVLGDIVLSLERAQEQSEEFGHSFDRECSYLIVHSVLHLLGYDHMIEKDKIKMRIAEEKILEAFNQSR